MPVDYETFRQLLDLFQNMMPLLTPINRAYDIFIVVAKFTVPDNRLTLTHLETDQKEPPWWMPFSLYSKMLSMSGQKKGRGK
jgi:hypothetical protein